MSPVAYAVRLGIARGWREFRNEIVSPDQWWNVFFAVVFLTVLIFQRDSSIEGTSLAMLTLPSLLGLQVMAGGYIGAGTVLSAEREDGTLLRAKAIPEGMVGYLVGRIVSLSLGTVIAVLVVLVPGVLLLLDLLDTSPAEWLTLLLVFGLGLLATLPWGAIVGSLVKTPQSAFGMTMLPMMALGAISGIFYPITALAGWMQGLAQVFPLYWIGLGMRSAVLPDSAAAAEIGGSWRTLETLGVLGVWAVAGLLIAPVVLRRMARRESGSLMERRREEALKRVS